MPERYKVINRKETKYHKELKLEWEDTALILENYGDSPIGDASQHLESFRRSDLKASIKMSKIKETDQGYGYYTYGGLDGIWICRGFVDSPAGVWEFRMISTSGDLQEALFCEILDSITFAGSKIYE